MKPASISIFLFSGLLLLKGTHAIRRNDYDWTGEGPKCPLDDPLNVTGPIAANLTGSPIIEILNGSSITNVGIQGLSTLSYNVTLNTILLTIDLDLVIDRFTANAAYSAYGFIDLLPMNETFPSGNFSGVGVGIISATGVHIKGRGVIPMNPPVVPSYPIYLRSVSIEAFQFDSLKIDLGNDFIIGGSSVDWDDLNENVKENFDREFLLHKTELTGKIRETFNNINRNLGLSLLDVVDFVQTPPGEGCSPN